MELYNDTAGAQGMELTRRPGVVGGKSCERKASKSVSDGGVGIKHVRHFSMERCDDLFLFRDELNHITRSHTDFLLVECCFLSSFDVDNANTHVLSLHSH